MSRKPKPASRPTRRELDLTKAEIVKIDGKLQACIDQQAKDAEQIKVLTGLLDAANTAINEERQRFEAVRAQRDEKSNRISDLNVIVSERNDTIAQMAQVQARLQREMNEAHDTITRMRRGETPKPYASGGMIKPSALTVGFGESAAI